eukprot:GFUD01016714.1.p1 GENE.GFUD01016714.1~~GFUD01016714.1.p1  ORF type:complete len:197 (-),score=27.02 GFUD01016714.1:176-766(-)
MASKTMIAFSCALVANIRTSLGSVAIGVGTRNPENANECLDPDTGFNHTIGVAWTIPGVCGQAHCEVRGENIYISYAFCGSAHAEYPCYLSAEPSLPYPYCCPRSYCPTSLDILTNEINTDDYEEELQMAANDVGNFVSVEAPEGFKNYDSDVDNISNNNENIVSYDVDMDDSYNSEEYQIDWDTLFSVPSSSLEQ